jgi:3-oxoacyl-[acyl-carrier protein] reductase
LIDPRLKDKTVIVTGANHGIGAATAIAFAEQKAKVFVDYVRASAEVSGSITEEEAAEATEPGRAYYYKMQTQTADEVVQTITDSGGTCYQWEADLFDPDNIPKLFDKAEEQLGHVDILVNNAAYGKCDTFIPAAELDEDEPFVGGGNRMCDFVHSKS